MKAWQLHCPVDIAEDSPRITLAHGEGGRQMRRLLETVIHPLLGSPRSIRDAAHFQLRSQQLALTTDSFVVSPLFFPGGDIGKLAVHGTVNDLAVSGAIPRYLSLSLILEEGLPLAILEQVIRSIARAAQECEVEIITGDTKVVPRGDADGIYINTTGLGEVLEPAVPGPTSLQPGDALLVTGPVGRHGIAILTAREQLDLQPLLESDVAPLWPAVQAAHQAAGQHLRAMRDATRGGVTAVLHEWAMESKLTLSIQEQLLPVHELTRSVCEVLGLEPLHLACEGTMLLSVSPEYAEATVSALRQTSVARQASIMGYVQTRSIAPVTIRRLLNREQSLEEPSGSPLPRIC